MIKNHWKKSFCVVNNVFRFDVLSVYVATYAMCTIAHHKHSQSTLCDTVIDGNEWMACYLVYKNSDIGGEGVNEYVTCPNNIINRLPGTYYIWYSYLFMSVRIMNIIILKDCYHNESKVVLVNGHCRPQ